MLTTSIFKIQVRWQNRKLNPSNLRKRYKDALDSLKEANATNKRPRFHDLRASYISLNGEAGTNIKFTMSQVGHSDPRVTLSIYAQVSDAAKREEAAKLSAYVFGAKAIG